MLMTHSNQIGGDFKLDKMRILIAYIAKGFYTCSQLVIGLTALI